MGVLRYSTHVIVALTGATGFIGRVLQSELLRCGHELRVLRRGPSIDRDVSTSLTRASESRKSAISQCVVDVADPASCLRALRGADAFIHLVGIIAETPHQRFERVHGELTRRWLDFAHQAGIRRWIQMSALGTRARAASRYHQTKWEAEELVRRSTLAWTILRPSIVHGAGDAFTHFFARMARWSPFLPVIGGGVNLMQPIAVEQVAKAFTRALGQSDTQGETLDLCGPERLALREILRCILEITERRRVLLPVPWTLARAQAALLEFVLTRRLGRTSPLTRDQLLMLAEDNVGDGSRADRLLGLEHLPFRDGLSRHLL